MNKTRRLARDMLYIVCLFSLMLYSGNADATPISIDNANFGTISGHPGAGTDMKMFSLTSPIDSYNALLLDLVVGGIYDGWRVASVDEVLDLWSDAGLPGIIGFYDANDQYTSSMKAFQERYGCWTTDDPNYFYTMGVVDGGDLLLGLGREEKYLYEVPDPAQLVSIVNTSYSFATDPNYQYLGEPAVCAWLVRDVQVVPEPATILLLISGILGAGSFRLRAKKGLL